MEKILLLLIFLISTSICKQMATIGVHQLVRFSLEENKDIYFYIEADNFRASDRVYLLVEVQQFDYSDTNLQICYTDENPNSITFISNCEFRSINYYKIDNSNSAINLYYQFPNNGDNIITKYIIVHYDLHHAYNGILGFICSPKDIYKEDEDKSDINTSNSESINYLIHFIILGFIIFGISFIGIYCKKKRLNAIERNEVIEGNLIAPIPVNFQFASSKNV